MRRLLAYLAIAMAGIFTGAALTFAFVGWVAIVEVAHGDANELAARQAYTSLDECRRKLATKPSWTMP